MYLDPNFGSLVIQVVIAFFAGIGAYAIMAKKSIMGVILRKSKKNSDESQKMENSNG